jgi:hypothetical protein
MSGTFVELHALRVLAITWNVNAKIESNIYSLRSQLLGLTNKENIYALHKASSIESSPTPSSSNADLKYEYRPETSNAPDLVIIGLQEIIELNTSNVLVGNSVIGQSSADQLMQWQVTLENALNYDINDTDSGNFLFATKRDC